MNQLAAFIASHTGVDVAFQQSLGGASVTAAAGGDGSLSIDFVPPIDPDLPTVIVNVATGADVRFFEADTGQELFLVPR